MSRSAYALLSVIVCPLLVAQQTQSASAPAQAPADQATAAHSPAPPPPHTLLDGTPVKLRLSQTMSSADAKVGQEVPFEVLEDLQVDGFTVLPKGATAIGIVTDANPKRSMGRAGKLDISISYARLVDQEKVTLRATKDSKGELFLHMYGTDITIPEGTAITAFVEGDMRLDMNKFGAKPTTLPGAPAVGQASMTVESNPPGADIEVDGSFVGNTPSTVTVSPGSHMIAVKKKGFADWSRKLNVTGGSIHLSADLEKAESPKGRNKPGP